MLEYIFFDDRPRRQFMAFLEQHAVPAETLSDTQGFLVRIPEETADALLQQIETFYDQMLDLNEALFLADGAADTQQHRAGVTVQLSDGRTVQALVEPALLNRLLQSVSTDELGQFVSAIADAVEHPDERSICCRGE